MAKSHIISAMIVTIPIVATLSFTPEEIMVILFLSTVGALFPDIDEKNSFISRRLYFVSKVFTLFTKHRQLTHTPVFIFLSGVAFTSILYFLGFEQWYLMWAFVLSSIIHTLGDMSTVEGGILFGYPFSKKRYYLLPKKFRIKTSRNVERYILIPIMGIIVCIELLLYKENIFVI